MASIFLHVKLCEEHRINQKNSRRTVQHDNALVYRKLIHGSILRMCTDKPVEKFMDLLLRYARCTGPVVFDGDTYVYLQVTMQEMQIRWQKNSKLTEKNM